MKRCLTSLVIREMLIKTTVRCHFTPTSVANIKKTDNNWEFPGSSVVRTLTAMGLGSIPEMVGCALVVTANRTNDLKYTGGH